MIWEASLIGSTPGFTVTLDGNVPILKKAKRSLIDSIEYLLETWDREFGYHDRQASKSVVKVKT